MLKSLEFENYRCFSTHVLPLKSETIIVGRNNAGKSTVIEAFRLIGLISERHKNLTFHEAPDWIELPAGDRGVRVDLSGLSLNWENLFHRYLPPPARVTASFYDGTELQIFLGPNRAMYAVLHDPLGRLVRTKAQARELSLPTLSVLPQVMPLTRTETILKEDYVRANVSSHLAPLHFRNQLFWFYNDFFDDFKSLVESSWPGLQIIELEDEHAFQDAPFKLLVRDGDFVAEVAWMGHGLQMWLQTMWFLTRTAGNTTIVLDEPDVYMHPDLQRRLLRFIRGRYPQCVIATHSTEILAEADPGNVLIVDRHRDRSNFTTTLGAVQSVLEHVGSAQNLQLTRLWNARKVLFVEGEDLKILRCFQDLLFPESKHPFDVLPYMSIGGWSNWPYAVGSKLLLKNAGGEKIMTYCVLDSDYHTEQEKQARKLDAAAKGVQLHIWSGKEIENYLIVPRAIARFIRRNAKPEHKKPRVAELEAAIEGIVESLKDSTTYAIAQEIQNEERSKGLPNAMAQASDRVEQAWSTFDGRILIVSGKQLLSNLSRWSKDTFNVSFGVNAIAKELQRNELRQEVIDTVTAIEKSNPMPS